MPEYGPKSGIVFNLLLSSSLQGEHRCGQHKRGEREMMKHTFVRWRAYLHFG